MNREFAPSDFLDGKKLLSLFGAYASFVDITDRKRIEEQLEDACPPIQLHGNEGYSRGKACAA